MTTLLALAALPGPRRSPFPASALLPDRPAPYVLRDWTTTTRAYDQTVFRRRTKGPYLPLVWRVADAPNLDRPGFGVPSYVGKEEMRGQAGEAVAALGSLLGPTMIGIDKRTWVELTPEFLNEAQGRILNNVGSKGSGSFWYDLLPAVVFTQLASKYPAWERGRTISKRMADAWRRATDDLKADFDHTSYDYEGRKPQDNGQWKEPEAAAAVAYLELFEGLRSGDRVYLDACRKALGSLDRRDDNPTYEVLDRLRRTGRRLYECDARRPLGCAPLRELVLRPDLTEPRGLGHGRGSLGRRRCGWPYGFGKRRRRVCVRDEHLCQRRDPCACRTLRRPPLGLARQVALEPDERLAAVLQGCVARRPPVKPRLARRSESGHRL